jgi:uncharacterized protein
MKYLVLLVVLIVGYAWWRGQRMSGTTPPPARPGQPPAPQDMVACARCGVHLPRTEALTSGQRSYCCAEHQRQDAH